MLSPPECGKAHLNSEGDFPEQPDPTFTRDRFSMKHSHGGGGFRPTAERIPFINSLFSALPANSGSTAQAPLWPSLAPIVGGRGVYDKDSKPEEQFWTTFFASGCCMAREMQEEIARIRRLRDEALHEALESAGLAANPPQSADFDRPDEGIGYRTCTKSGRSHSRNRLCGKMKLEGMEFVYLTIYTWCQALGIKKYRRYIKPKLMPRHYISRLEWVLGDLVKDESGVPKLLPYDPILGERACKFVHLIDRVHIDGSGST